MATSLAARAAALGGGLRGRGLLRLRRDRPSSVPRAHGYGLDCADLRLVVRATSSGGGGGGGKSWSDIAADAGALIKEAGSKLFGGDKKESESESDLRRRSAEIVTADKALEQSISKAFGGGIMGG